MLALADRFPEWEDFPKGLHVMVVDEDKEVIDDVKTKLDSCGYLVTAYCKGQEALQALEDGNKSFHVVVVDATTSDALDGFKIVAAAKHLTTIMMASTENMNIMMQGIAAGASEFLQKPLSEERLKNIWQHVVRKALVTGHLAAPTDIAPTSKAINPPLITSNEDENLLNLKQETTFNYKHALYDIPDAHLFFQEEDQSSYFDLDEKDNCDALLCSTPPQLEQSSRVPTEEDNPDGSPLSHGFSVTCCMKRELDDDCFDDCEDYLHIKSEVEEAVNNSTILNELFDSKGKDDYLLNHELDDPKLCADLQFDDIPDSLDDITLSSELVDGDVLSGLDTNQSLSIGLDCLDDEGFQEADEEALLLAEVAKAEKGMGNPRIGSQFNVVKPLNGSISRDMEEVRSKSDSEQSCNKGSKISSGKKKMKVDWTPELHRRFVQAVEQLGVDKAIPSRILELMGVKCLTRHNIASHLQKYRSHRKHLLAREAEAASWNQRRQMEAAAVAGGRAASATAGHQHHHAWPAALPAPQSQPRSSHAPLPLAAGAPPLHVWGHPTLEHAAMHFWPAWPPPACQLDAWGNPFYPPQPILRMPLAPMPSVANMAVPRAAACGKLASLHPPKETVVAAINEVLRNPYIPLPLGLKPPSLESVVSELQRQGISMVPPAIV